LPVPQVSSFIEEWRRAYEDVHGYVQSRLCHPDLTARNMIRSASSGDVFVVDNELLGVGPGWVLDWHNAGVPESALSDFAHSTQLDEFVQLSWKLRKLGSLLDAYDYQAVQALLSE
jgi:hypothetical protein